jgi:hypothetical protein
MKRATYNEFVEKANKVHNHRYSYSFVDYTNIRTKVKIVCNHHGEFLQSPNSHLAGHGCPTCAGVGKSTIDFIRESMEIHNNKYSYKKACYTGNRIKVEIICPKHGSFFQIPNSHLSGKGCPRCKISRGEIEVIKVLIRNNIKYFYQKMFDDCRNPKSGNLFKYDFYLPQHNLLIEYDGPQHFSNGKFKGYESSEEELKDTQYRDGIKTKYAEDNKIGLLRIKYTDRNRIEDILRAALKQSI